MPVRALDLRLSGSGDGFFKLDAVEGESLRDEQEGEVERTLSEHTLLFSPFFGQLQRVKKEHGDRHRPDAARHRGDGGRFAFDRVKIHIAAEFAGFVAVDPDIDHDRRLP